MDDDPRPHTHRHGPPPDGPLAADGADVVEGIDPPSEEQLAAHAERTPEEVQAYVDAQLAEVDAEKDAGQ